MFSKAYDTPFPEIRKMIKTKSSLSPWITKGIQISKRKQELYEKFLKKWTYTSEKIYITIVKISLKNSGTNISNKLDCKSQFLKYESGVKRTWNMI